MNEFVVNTEIENFTTAKGCEGREGRLILRDTKRLRKEMYSLVLRTFSFSVFRQFTFLLMNRSTLNHQFMTGAQ